MWSRGDRTPDLRIAKQTLAIRKCLLFRRLQPRKKSGVLHSFPFLTIAYTSRATYWPVGIYRLLKNIRWPIRRSRVRSGIGRIIPQGSSVLYRIPNRSICIRTTRRIIPGLRTRASLNKNINLSPPISCCAMKSWCWLVVITWRTPGGILISSAGILSMNGRRECD